MKMVEEGCGKVYEWDARQRVGVATRGCLGTLHGIATV